MAELKLPTRASWLDPIKKKRKLEIYFHASLGTNGWAKVFEQAITEFNTLSKNHQLGVTMVQGKVQKKAQVEVHAAKGNVQFEYMPYITKRTIRFDGKSVHGLCKPLLTTVNDKAKVEQWRVMRAFIYVPAAPTGDRNGKPSVVGDGVKLVIAVHEFLHACGLVDDKEHTVDDVFCWPRLHMGNKPSEDKLSALGEKYKFKGLPGEPDRVGHRDRNMPPIVLQKTTANKIRKLWV